MARAVKPFSDSELIQIIDLMIRKKRMTLALVKSGRELEECSVDVKALREIKQRIEADV